MKKAGKLEELPFPYREALKNNHAIMLEDTDSMILIAKFKNKELAKNYFNSVKRNNERTN